MYTGDKYFENPNLVDMEMDLDPDLVIQLKQMAEQRQISFDEMVSIILEECIRNEEADTK